MSSKDPAPLNGRIRYLWFTVLWAVFTLPFLSRLVLGQTSHDVELYWVGGSAVLQGARIYTDVVFEYPPYALLWFVGPAAVSGNLAEFRVVFGLLIWAIDAAVKGYLLWQALVSGRRVRDFLPFALYISGTAALGHFLLQRYDVIPAALSMAALLWLVRGWPATAGAVIALAIGAKVYPVLYVPVMAVYAARRSRSDVLRFAVAGAITLLPLLIAVWWMPWWRFATFHAGRGLQVESAWASVVWMLHFAGVPARWEFITAWNEVTGPVAERLVGPATTIWVAATGLSLWRAVMAARRLFSSASDTRTRSIGDTRLASGESVSSLALLMLMPVLSFVAFSPVLSPQFHLWLLPWCALGLVSKNLPALDASLARRAIWCIFLATLIVPVFYPSKTYTHGLDIGRTAALVFRNGLLIYAAACLWVSAGRRQATLS